MRSILDTLVGCLENGETVVLGGIIGASGSVPRSSGARMLVTADGRLYGSVGGGMVEGSCHDRAKKLLAAGTGHELAEFHMQPSDAAEAGMVCGGSVTVLLQCLSRNELPLFQQLREAYRTGQRPVLLTFVAREEAPRLALLHRDAEGLVPEELTSEITRKNRRQPFVTLSGVHEVLVEPLVHPGVVHLAGAGHVAQATAPLAVYAGFDVVVMDDREEFANRQRFPEAREIRVLDGFADCLTDLGPDDYAVIVTRGHIHDRDVLAQALNTRAGYIGMIGSKKKVRAVFDSLLAQGFSEEDLQRVHSPIGLAIGADTPAEIGFSIVAQLIKVRADR